MDKIKIGGILESDGRALLRLLAVPNQLDAPGVLTSALAAEGINLELLVHTVDLQDGGNFAAVVAQKDLARSLVVLEKVESELQARGTAYVPDVAVVSAFGPHLREKPRIPGLLFTSLAAAGVSPLAISTSISSISFVVAGTELDTAVEAMLEVFEAPFRAAKRPKNW